MAQYQSQTQDEPPSEGPAQSQGALSGMFDEHFSAPLRKLIDA